MTKISPLQVGEAAAAAALWEEAGLVRGWNDPQADVVAALTCPTAVVLASREIGRITGTVMAGYDGHRGWLYYLAVANDRRDTGTGQALVKADDEWLARWSCAEVALRHPVDPIRLGRQVLALLTPRSRPS